MSSRVCRQPLVLAALAAIALGLLLVIFANRGRDSGDHPDQLGVGKGSVPVESEGAQPQAQGRGKSAERKPKNDFIDRWSQGQAFTADELLRHAQALTLSDLPEFLSVAMAADIPGPQRSMLTSVAVAAVTRREPISDVMAAISASLPPGKIRDRCALAAFEMSSDPAHALLNQLKEIKEGSEKECALEGVCFKLRRTKTIGELMLTKDSLQGEEGGRILTTLGSRITQEDPKNRQAAYEESYRLVRENVSGRDDGANVTAAFIANASSSVPELAWETWRTVEPSERGEDPERVELLILKNLAMKRPEATADRILSDSKEPAETARQLSQVLETWIGSDNNAAQAWGSRTAAEMAPEALNATAAVFARFHIKKGAREEAAGWIEKISNPELKGQLDKELK